MIVGEFDVVVKKGTGPGKVSIIIPLYNYAHHVIETLESIRKQTFDDLALIVVNDCSTDESEAVVDDWIRKEWTGKCSATLVTHKVNRKLAITRNTGISIANSAYCFMLDADNVIYPKCIEKHWAALERRPDADACYSLLEVFEGARDIIGAGVFTREALIHGNFIDAMAMFRRTALLEMGGYEHIPSGWEDYDLWLRMIEQNRIALHLPEILSRYRQHGFSMLRTETNVGKNITALHEFMTKRHPWLELH